jgi:hypothetical protein
LPCLVCRGLSWPVLEGSPLEVEQGVAGSGRGRVERLAEAQTSVQGQTIRLGGGFADVLATRAGGRHRTEIDTTKGVGADEVDIGHTLRAARPTAVLLNGRPCTTIRFSRSTARPR